MLARIYEFDLSWDHFTPLAGTSWGNGKVAKVCKFATRWPQQRPKDREGKRIQFYEYVNSFWQKKLSLHQVGRWPQKSKIKIFQQTHTHKKSQAKVRIFGAATKLKYATKRGTSKMQQHTWWRGTWRARTKTMLLCQERQPQQSLQMSGEEMLAGRWWTPSGTFMSQSQQHYKFTQLRAGGGQRRSGRSGQEVLVMNQATWRIHVPSGGAAQGGEGVVVCGKDLKGGGDIIIILHFAAVAGCPEPGNEDADNVTNQQTTVEKVCQALQFNCGIKLNAFCGSSMRQCNVLSVRKVCEYFAGKNFISFTWIITSFNAQNCCHNVEAQLMVVLYYITDT